MIEDDELRSLFQAETEERLKSLEAQLAKLETNSQDKSAIESAFRDAHTIKGSARMLNIQAIETIAHQLENSLDQVRKGEITLSSQAIQHIYEGLYAIQSLVNEALTGQIAKVDITAIVKLLNFNDLAISKDSAPQLKTVENLSLKKDEDTSLLSPKPSLAENSTTQDSPSEKIKEQPPQEKEVGLKKEEQSPLFSTVRIDVQHINHLMSQAADLTVAKNRMVRVFERIEDLLEVCEEQYDTYQQPYFTASYSGLKNKTAGKGQESFIPKKPIFEAFKEIGENPNQLRNDTYEDVNKLELITASFTDQMQKLSLVPLSKLFDFFPRMVRDLALSVGKEVEFIVTGAELTVDKKIIENMKDPLMHLLRNAISHGIETAAEREKKGKSPRGVIQLIGKQTSHSIIIEVLDNGSGLDSEKIKEVAIKRQILSDNKAKTLTLTEMHALILLPGFSTATQVSDLSGRGVGLDVVKTQVEQLQGSLTVESLPSQGCRFIIELPIIHITTQVLLAEVDKRIYALPMDMVEACILISTDQISHVEGRDVIFMQNQPLPIIFLRNLIGLSVIDGSKDSMQTAQSCIIVKAQGKRVALIVDRILDEQKVVVIPPNRLLSKVKSLIGVTILKTGEACVILNPFDLVISE